MYEQKVVQFWQTKKDLQFELNDFQFHIVVPVTVNLWEYWSTTMSFFFTICICLWVYD